MKSKTKILSIIAMLLLCFTVLPINIFAAEEPKYEQIPIYHGGNEIANANALLIDGTT